MAALIPFIICDELTGLPVSGAASQVTVQAWNASTLATRTAPSSQEEGTSANYFIQPTEQDESVGTVYLLTAADGYEPKYQVLYAFQEDKSNQFFAVLFLNENGTLYNGAVPTMNEWSGSGSAPVWLKPSAGVFVAHPSSDDVQEGAMGRVNAPVGCIPSFYLCNTEELPTFSGANPVIENLSPVGTIPRFTTVEFDLIGLENTPAVVWAMFHEGSKEVIFDGTGFTERYENSERTPISGGFRFRVARQNGWYSSPTFDAGAFIEGT